MKLDFPVYETGEVDGAVEVEREGQRAPLPGIRLQVVDGDGKVVAQALSGYDGSFFVQGVRLGSFTLRADSDQLAKLHLAALPPKAVELSHDSPAATAGTITLTRSKGEDRAGQADSPVTGLPSQVAPATPPP